MRGLIALVDLYGGLTSVLGRENESPMPGMRITLWYEYAARYFFRIVLLTIHLALCISIGISCNSTSPITDQLSGMEHWTDDECVRVFNSHIVFSLPCPTTLFLAMRHITHLRIAASEAPHSSTPNLIAAAKSIALEICTFSPENWVRDPHVLTSKAAKAYARAFKTAMILYAVLSLPKKLAQPFIDDRRGSRHARLYYRSALWTAIFHTNDIPSPRSTMGWPLAVLGASYWDGPAQDQAVILHELDDIRYGVPGVTSAPVALSQTLYTFWQSGKTRWDDCFTRPISVLMA